MTAFFDAISSFIDNIVTFFTNFLESLRLLFVSIPAAITWLRYIVSFIPAPVGVFCLLMVVISVLFLVLGRNS